MQSDDINRIISDAIDHHLGNIGSLPEEAQSMIHKVYEAFYKAYMDIAKKNGLINDHGEMKITDMHPEIIAYMRHFFSDYQSILRDFLELNHRAKYLIKIDRDKNPAGYEEKLQELLSGKEIFSDGLILDKLLKMQNYEA